MFKKIFLTLSLLFLTACQTQTNSSQLTPHYPDGEIATFAGGCFWCMEPPFENLEGTKNVVADYAGGKLANANYKAVGTGKTKHREAVQVNYDSNAVSYAELVDVFLQQIDPTDDGGQFADRGFQYTTAIYYHNNDQKKTAEEKLKELELSKKFDQNIAVKIEPYTTFFLAEDYHQDFYKKSAAHYERYKKGSGRADFIEENWAKEAALEYSR